MIKYRSISLYIYFFFVLAPVCIYIYIKISRFIFLTLVSNTYARALVFRIYFVYIYSEVYVFLFPRSFIPAVNLRNHARLACFVLNTARLVPIIIDGSTVRVFVVFSRLTRKTYCTFTNGNRLRFVC